VKGYIEFRSADSQPPERTVALPALVKGVFYEADCLGAAFDLVKHWRYEDTVALYREVTRDALRAKMRGIAVAELAKELLAIAEEGLRRQAVLDGAGRDERVHLDHLAEQLSTGRSPARVIAEKWDREWHRDVERLIAFSAFRTV
jgi:glutamate--cysteine ligase